MSGRALAWLFNQPTETPSLQPWRAVVYGGQGTKNQTKLGLIKPMLGLKLAWHLASRRSQHNQQVPESLEAQRPAWLCPTTCIHGDTEAWLPVASRPCTPSTRLVRRLVILHLGRPAYNTITPHAPEAWTVERRDPGLLSGS